MKSLDEKIWALTKDVIIKKALVQLGLSAINPVGKVMVYVGGYLLEKFVKPHYQEGVAQGIKVWSQHFEAKKLRELDEAIKDGDRETTLDILDSLK